MGIRARGHDITYPQSSLIWSVLASLKWTISSGQWLDFWKSRCYYRQGCCCYHFSSSKLIVGTVAASFLRCLMIKFSTQFICERDNSQLIQKQVSSILNRVWGRFFVSVGLGGEQLNEKSSIRIFWWGGDNTGLEENLGRRRWTTMVSCCVCCGIKKILTQHMHSNIPYT